MTAYLELHLKGNGRAFIEAGSIVGVITGDQCQIDTPGTPSKPLHVYLRGRSEPLEVLGESAMVVLARAIQARKRVRVEQLDALMDYLTPLGDGDDLRVEK